MIDNIFVIASAVVVVLAVGTLSVVGLRALRQRDADAARTEMAELARLQAETTLRLEGMRDLLAGRQAELHRAVNERLDSVTHHLNQSMTATRENTSEHLQKLNERLAVIDGAQKNITELASQ